MLSSKKLISYIGLKKTTYASYLHGSPCHTMSDFHIRDTVISDAKKRVAYIVFLM